MKTTSLLLILLAAGLSSCAVSRETIAPLGNVINVQTRGGSEFTGTLVEVDSTSILWLAQEEAEGRDTSSKLCRTNLQEIKTLRIVEPTPQWTWGLLGFSVAPTALFLVTMHANVARANPLVDIIVAVPSLLIWAIYAASDPGESRFEAPLTCQNKQSLRRYAHFPQGLTDLQRAELLSLCHLTKPREVR
jgi:hypothetical protein